MKIKLVYILILVTLSTTIFGENFIDKTSKIESLFLKVEEKTYLNGKKKEKGYTVKIKLPNMMYKEMDKPQINKGEIYIYKGNKKTVYLPKLNQIIEKELENEENYIMMVINDIKDLSNVKIVDGKFEDVYKTVFFNKESKQIVKIEYKDGLSIIFEEFRNEFPSRFSVYDEKNLIAEIKFLEIISDIKYKDSDFSLSKQDAK